LSTRSRTCVTCPVICGKLFIVRTTDAWRYFIVEAVAGM
jgi:hypothetical protein